jgi:hypothetical protein
MNKITRCDNCPFCNSDSEYGCMCNHPSFPDVNNHKLKWILKPGEQLRWEIVNPKECPLRSVDIIAIPEAIEIELDPTLMEEYFTANNPT